MSAVAALARGCVRASLLRRQAVHAFLVFFLRLIMAEPALDGMRVSFVGMGFIAFVAVDTIKVAVDGLLDVLGRFVAFQTVAALLAPSFFTK